MIGSPNADFKGAWGFITKRSTNRFALRFVHTVSSFLIVLVSNCPGGGFGGPGGGLGGPGDGLFSTGSSGGLPPLLPVLKPPPGPPKPPPGPPKPPLEQLEMSRFRNEQN